MHTVFQVMDSPRGGTLTGGGSLNQAKSERPPDGVPSLQRIVFVCAILPDGSDLPTIVVTVEVPLGQGGIRWAGSSIRPSRSPAGWASGSYESHAARAKVSTDLWSNPAPGGVAGVAGVLDTGAPGVDPVGLGPQERRTGQSKDRRRQAES